MPTKKKKRLACVASEEFDEVDPHVGSKKNVGRSNARIGIRVSDRKEECGVCHRARRRIRVSDSKLTKGACVVLK